METLAPGQCCQMLFLMQAEEFRGSIKFLELLSYAYDAGTAAAVAGGDGAIHRQDCTDLGGEVGRDGGQLLVAQLV